MVTVGEVRTEDVAVTPAAIQSIHFSVTRFRLRVRMIRVRIRISVSGHR